MDFHDSFLRFWWFGMKSAGSHNVTYKSPLILQIPFFFFLLKDKMRAEQIEYRQMRVSGCFTRKKLSNKDYISFCKNDSVFLKVPMITDEL